MCTLSARRSAKHRLDQPQERRKPRSCGAFVEYRHGDGDPFRHDSDTTHTRRWCRESGPTLERDAIRMRTARSCESRTANTRQSLLAAPVAHSSTTSTLLATMVPSALIELAAQPARDRRARVGADGDLEGRRRVRRLDQPSGAIERGEINPTFLTLLRLTSGIEIPLSGLIVLYEKREADIRPGTLIGTIHR